MIDANGTPTVLLDAPTLVSGFISNADANGDGLSEMVFTSSFGSQMKWFNGTSMSQLTILFPSGTCGVAPPVTGDTNAGTFGDVNGNGYADLAVYDTRNNSADRICVALSNGWSFGPYDIWANLPNYSTGVDSGNPNYYPLGARIDDVNGDGLGDVIADISYCGAHEAILDTSGHVVPSHRIKVFLSKGASFSTVSDATVQAYVTQGDFVGDGRTDFSRMKGAAGIGGSGGNTT